MKKIITLITMFVLSVGFLTAQGVFTYQALVYNNGSLVVDDSVDATVTITDGERTYSQTSRVYASLNGLATIPVGNAENENFNNINWSKAKITVKFAVDNAQVTVADNEQIPAVPYALQANTKLTTPMLITYINGASKNDMIRIDHAMTEDLQKAVLGAIIDSMIKHYDLSKEIIMEYLSQLDAQDAGELFDSLVNNENRVELMRAAAAILLENLETTAGKDAMLAIAKNYATNLTAAELDAILDAVPENVRNVVADSIITYLLRQTITVPSDNGTILDPDFKDALERVAKNYIEHATTDEVQSMITALQNNENHAIDILVNYFNEKYMRDYVDSVVKRYLMANYYYCEEGTPANVCGTTDCDFESGDMEVAPYGNPMNGFLGSFHYDATADQIVVTSLNATVLDSHEEQVGVIEGDLNTVDFAGDEISFFISTADITFNIPDGYIIQVSVTVQYTCGNSSYSETVYGDYIDQ